MPHFLAIFYIYVQVIHIPPESHAAHKTHMKIQQNIFLWIMEWLDAKRLEINVERRPFLFLV